MEFKHYSVYGEIEGKEVTLLSTKIEVKEFAGVGEFINGKLVEPKYYTVNRKEISDLIEWELKEKKSYEFIQKLAEKIEGLLNK